MHVFFGRRYRRMVAHVAGTRWLDRHLNQSRLMLFMESQYCSVSSFPLYWWSASWQAFSSVLIWRETLCMSFLGGQCHPSLGHTNWSTLWQAHHNAQRPQNCPLTCPQWPIPWWPTYRSSLPWHKHDKSLRRPHPPVICSVLGPRMGHALYSRWNQVGVLSIQWSNQNSWYSGPCSQAPECYSWIWAYPARHQGWMGDGSGQWVTVLGSTRAQASSVPSSCRNDLGAANKGGPL